MMLKIVEIGILNGLFIICLRILYVRMRFVLSNIIIGRFWWSWLFVRCEIMFGMIKLINGICLMVMIIIVVIMVIIIKVIYVIWW